MAKDSWNKLHIALGAPLMMQYHAPTHALTDRNMLYLLLFHGNSGFANAPHFYGIRTLPFLSETNTVRGLFE
jgi:hypothetical protein